MDTIGLIPAFNEEKTIQEVISRIKGKNILPLVIDDGSSDKTYKLAKKAGAVVIKHDKNKGKGEALRTGIDYILKNYPRAKYIVVVDSDMQYLPEEWTRLVEPLRKGEADYVIGCRDWDQVPYRHRLGNFVWRMFFNLLFGTAFLDTNCGFIAFKKEVAEKIRNIYGGYIIDNAMAIQALKNEFRIKNVPVSVVYKKKRDIRSGVKVVVGVLMFILREGFKHRLSKI